MITLQQTIDIIKRISPDYDIYFEGRGDGTVKLIVEEKKITIINKREVNSRKWMNKKV